MLPYSVVKWLPGLRLSLPGVKEEKGRQPRRLGNYSYNTINSQTLSIAPLVLIQYGRDIDRLLRKIMFADPTLGPVYMMKGDVSDGFYLIYLRPEDVPKLGLVSLGWHEGEDDYTDHLVAVPLTLPKELKKSPPLFCVVTKTLTDLANAVLRAKIPTRPHKLDDRAEAIVLVPVPPHNKETPQLCWNPYLGRLNAQLLVYVDVFVDDFLGLVQRPRHQRCHVRRTLFHALDKVL